MCGRKIPVGPDNDCAKLGLWGMFDKFGVAIGYRPGITGRDLADTVLHEAILFLGPLEQLVGLGVAAQGP